MRSTRSPSPGSSKKRNKSAERNDVPQTKPGKFQGIQALRFIAALLVVITHSTFYAHERLSSSIPVWNDGVVGVRIFFVISGFVMIASTASLAGDRDGWKYFSMRRVLRIVPMYWMATTVKLFTMLILPAAVLHSALDPGKVVLSYLFLPSRNAEGAVEPLLGVGWTLIFEMFFYAVFALALLLRANVVYFTGAVLIVMSAGSLLRGTDWPAWAVYFDPIVLYFLIGMLVAKLTLSPRARRWAPPVLGVLAAAILFMVIHPDIDASLNNPYFEMPAVSAVVLLVAWLEPLIGQYVPRFAVFLGAASYTLYLFHPLIAPAIPVVLDRLGVTNGVASVLLSIAVALGSTAIIYRLVELPVTTWLQARLPYVQRPPQVARAVKTAEPLEASNDRP
jgi:exopolysaccharide production protein ExoZ